MGALPECYGLLDGQAAVAADSEFFVEARITALEPIVKGGERFVRVRGTADADRFASARVEIGEGRDPKSWRAVPPNLIDPVTDRPIAEIPGRLFGGSKLWTVRLVTEHANGRRREYRMNLKLD